MNINNSFDEFCYKEKERNRITGSRSLAKRGFVCLFERGWEGKGWQIVL